MAPGCYSEYIKIVVYWWNWKSMLNNTSIFHFSGTSSYDVISVKFFNLQSFQINHFFGGHFFHQMCALRLPCLYCYSTVNNTHLALNYKKRPLPLFEYACRLSLFPSWTLRNPTSYLLEHSPTLTIPFNKLMSFLLTYCMFENILLFFSTSAAQQWKWSILLVIWFLQ